MTQDIFYIIFYGLLRVKSQSEGSPMFWRLQIKKNWNLRGRELEIVKDFGVTNHIFFYLQVRPSGADI